MKKLSKQLCSTLLAFVVITSSSWMHFPDSYAADDSISFVQVQVALTNDANGNNIANIGDQLTLFVVLNNADGGCVAQNTQVFANLSAYGGSANQSLNCASDNAGTGDQFGHQFVIQDGGGSAIDVAANNAASRILVTATDSDENNGAGNPNPNQNSNPLGDGVVDTVATNGVDTGAPQVTDGAIQAVLTVDNGAVNVAEINDVIRVTWDNSGAGDNNSDTLSGIQANLSEFGGSANQQLFDDGTNGDQTGADGVYTYDYTVVAGSINASNLNATVMVADNGGNLTATADTSNLSVNNVQASGGRRRQSIVNTSEEPSAGESTVPGSEEEMVSCGCQQERELLDSYSELLLGSYLIGPTSSTIMCVNPVCLETDSGNNRQTGEETNTEKKFREAMIDMKEASKKIDETFNKVRKAEKEHQDATNEQEHARLEIQLGPNPGESMDNYNQRMQNARNRWKKSDEERKQAKVRLDEAEEKYQEARNDHQEKKKKLNEQFEKLKEEVGVEKANEIYSEAVRTPVTPISLCVDPVCSGNTSANPHFQADWLQAQKNLNSCLQQCGLPAEKAWQTSKSDADFNSTNQHLPVQMQEAVPQSQDFGPFNPLSAGQMLPQSSRFAEDIEGHRSEPFILQLYQLQVVNGVGNGKTFEPDMPLTKAALLKVAYETFGKSPLQNVTKSPFVDVDPTEWYSGYFEAAKGTIIQGVGEDAGLPIGERRANPTELVSRINALTILTRVGNIELSSAADYQSPLVDDQNPLWWHPIWKWAEMNGVVNTDEVTVEVNEPIIAESPEELASEVQTTVVTETVAGDKPTDQITRGEMAEMAVKVSVISRNEPCNCDEEKAAWEKAKQEAEDAKKAAEQAKSEAETSEQDAKDAEAEAKKANDKVKDLEGFFDDSSFVETEKGKYTRGDMLLLREANQAIYGAWAAGSITAQEAMEQWENTNIENLEDLRAQKQQELDEARDAQKQAQEKADNARSKAEADEAKAKKLQEDADKADQKEADAKKAYEDCQVKCNQLKKEVAEQRRKAEAERRRRAIEEEKRRRAEERRQQEEERRRRQQGTSTPPPTSSGPGATTDGDGGGGGIPPAAAKDPCKEKFLQAIAARGKQIAETRPDDVPDVPPVIKPIGDFTTAIGDMIANAASVAAQGGSSAASVAGALTALPSIAYGLWVDYVGDAIKEAGTRIINNSRICQTIKFSTTGKCGYESFPPGQVVYWEKDANGNYQVVVMGPGDNVTKGQCK